MYLRFAISILDKTCVCQHLPRTSTVTDVGMQADLFLSASSPIPPVSPTEATFSYGDNDFDEM